MIGAVVDEVLEEMENATNEGMKAADDYMDAETGLLVCGNCHTKKQKKISFLGKERVVGCLCRCAAEKLEKERARHEAEENLMRIRQMKSAGLQDRTFYGYTFERCDVSQENAVYAKRYVFEGQDRKGMIADIKNVIPHIQDSDMVELAGQVLGKLETMSDAEFAEVALEAAE